MSNNVWLSNHKSALFGPNLGVILSASTPIAETTGSAQPNNSLLIIPDGSPLWLMPDPDDEDQKHMPLDWRLDAISALMEQLPASNIPVLIGAESCTADQLLAYQPQSDEDNWSEVQKATGMDIMLRFPGTPRSRVTYGELPTKTELWFVTKESFDTGVRTNRKTSRRWSNSLRRLGFDVRTWNNSLDLIENLDPKDKKRRIRNAVLSDTRPTHITIGALVDLKLVNTTSYELGD